VEKKTPSNTSGGERNRSCRKKKRTRTPASGRRKRSIHLRYKIARSKSAARASRMKRQWLERKGATAVIGLGVGGGKGGAAPPAPENPRLPALTSEKKKKKKTPWLLAYSSKRTAALQLQEEESSSPASAMTKNRVKKRGVLATSSLGRKKRRTQCESEKEANLYIKKGIILQ